MPVGIQSATLLFWIDQELLHTNHEGQTKVFNSNGYLKA